jgi:hypothetical protein
MGNIDPVAAGRLRCVIDIQSGFTRTEYTIGYSIFAVARPDSGWRSEIVDCEACGKPVAIRAYSVSATRGRRRRWRWLLALDVVVLLILAAGMLWYSPARVLAIFLFCLAVAALFPLGSRWMRWNGVGVPWRTLLSFHSVRRLS